MSVNKLKSKPLSDIKTVKLKYLDDTISFDKIDYATSETFNFSFYNLLRNPNDIAVNNYSYFFLSKKGLFSDQISYIQKENEVNAILTPLKFNYFNAEYYLYFESTTARESTVESNVFVNDVSLYSLTVLNRQGINDENITDYSGHLFIIEFITGTNKCYIKHISNSHEYYLYNDRITGTPGSYAKADTIAFTTDKNVIEQFGQFTYIIDDNKISLSLVEPEMIYVAVDGVTITSTASDGTLITEPAKTWVHQTLNVDNTTNTLIEAPNEKDKCRYYIRPEYVGHSFTIENKIRIRSLNNVAGSLHLIDNRNLVANFSNQPAIFKQIKNTLGPSSYINSAWLSYNSDSSLEINEERSAFNLENQCIYHLQYNNIDTTDYSTTVNIIPLKNHVSPGNNIIRGDYLNNDLNSEKPNTDFREYTSIETGGIREFGNDTIVLTYTYYNEEYSIKPGSDFVFTLRKNNDSLSGDNKYALYPYKQLNINNSQFVNNGACGSDVPILADKVKKMQKNSTIFNNGRYLCTWLYQTPELKQGIWLDRYYYPDRISKKESYYGTIQLSTETDIIDKNYIYKDGSWNTVDNTALGNVTYFDKQSDLVFEPGVTYTYSRVGSDDIEVIIDKIKPFSIDTVKKFTTTDGTVTIESNKLANSGALDLSFDMFINPEKTYGPCIMSNSVVNGFSITNEDDITPFIYTFDGTVIRLHSTIGQIINTFDINEFYPGSTDICFITIEKPFKDIVAVTLDSIYLFSFDLLLKKRIKIDFLTKENVSYWNSNYYTPITAVLGNNNLYMLISKDIDNDIDEALPRYQANRIIRINLIDNSWNELNKYSKTGISIVKLGSEYIPIQQINNQGTYVTNDKKYPLPLNSVTTSVISETINNPEYTSDYWYFAPEFLPDIGDAPVNNASAIKSLYLQDGKLYAFPYHKTGRMQDSDLIYGIRQRTSSLGQVELIYLTAYELLSKDTGSTNTAFQTYSQFTHFAINDKEEFILVKKKDDKDYIMIFDAAKRLLRTIELQALGYTDIFAVDSLKLYVNGDTKSVFAGIVHHYDDVKNETTTRLILIDISGAITDFILDVGVSDKLPYLINYSSIIANFKKGLKFNLNVENRHGIAYEFTYLLDYSDISQGWYTFNIIIDSNANIFEVYCNNKLLQPLCKIDISTIGDKHLFDNPILIGALKYKRNTLLSDFLGEDKNTFNSKNVTIRNINLYNKILSSSESQAVALAKSELQPVVITLPCGQKNNLEEIIRYFKFSPPPNVSNTISIDIKHSGIDNINIQKQLSVDILNKINNELLLPATIKEINFI